MSDKRQSFYQLIDTGAAGGNGSWPYSSSSTPDFSRGKVMLAAQQCQVVHVVIDLLIPAVKWFW